MARRLELAACADCGAAFSRSADGGTKGMYCAIHARERKLAGLAKLYRVIEENQRAQRT